VVPRAWTIYFAEMVGRAATLPDAVPSEWVERAERETGGERVPRTLGEREVSARGNEGAAGWVVGDLRRKVFPLHGLA
jgi:hypothetical protein